MEETVKEDGTQCDVPQKPRSGSLSVPLSVRPQLVSLDALSSSPDWISRPFDSELDTAANATGETHGSGLRDLAMKSREISAKGSLLSVSGEEVDVESISSANCNSRTFFWPLLVSDEEARKRCLQSICRLLLASATDDSQHRLIRAHLSTLVRLAFECPFSEVRDSFTVLLADVANCDIGVSIPTSLEGFSHFVDASKSSLPSLLQSSRDPVLVSKLCRMAFLQRGRASHLVQLLAWHPTYLELFYHTYDFLMHGPGPLPLAWRTYICILAASRHKCSYVVDMQEKVFPEHGGVPEWLDGICYSPQKMQNLAELNAILAHQPWRLTAAHISSLVSGTDAWSMSELVQAIVLIASTQSLASLAFGCGLTQELEGESLWATQAETPQSSSAEDDPVQGITQSLYNALSELVEDDDEVVEDGGDAFEIVDSDRKTELEMGVEEQVSKEESDEDDLVAAIECWDGGEDEMARYWGGIEMQHEDFDVKSHEYRILHVSDYCWEDQAFALVSQYYTEAAPLLDELFRHIYSLTYRTFSSKEDVNTDPLRAAVVHYVHRIQGIFHDDYSYQKVNRFLPRPMKAFIKKVACTPQLVSHKDFVGMGVNLTVQEKCHLTLLIVEARKQAALVYGLRAISGYLAA